MPSCCVFARFLKNGDASIAPLMALAILPLFGVVGAAVDYSRAASIRSAMQAALDSSALMLSKDAQTFNTANLSQKANDDFKALFNRPEAYDIQVATQFTQPAQGNFALKLTASARASQCRLCPQKRTGSGDGIVSA